MEYVWYASYGSNILEDRFICYIEGTRYKYNRKSEFGCLNKQLPRDSRAFTFNRGLTFTFNSLRWNGGGVAFLDKEKNDKTAYGKIYKITKEQFTHIYMQENGLNPLKDELTIDFDKLNSNKSLLAKNSWYGLILQVDEIDGLPVYTFTNPNNLDKYNCPSIEYLQTIITGIKSSRNISNTELKELFSSYNGIADSKECSELLKQIEKL